MKTTRKKYFFTPDKLSKRKKAALSILKMRLNHEQHKIRHHLHKLKLKLHSFYSVLKSGIF